MARLAIAVILVLAALALVATFFAGLSALRREAAGASGNTFSEGSVLDKVAFMLLIMLIIYVSASGGA